MSVWLLIFLCGGATFLTRFLPISELAPKKLPSWASEALGFVPVGILSAIIAPAVFMPEGQLMVEGNHRIWAALIASIVAFYSRSVVATLAAGLGSLWTLIWLFG